MIGKKIKTLRLANNLSISELAEQAGVAKSYLSSIERNLQTNPSLQFIEKISHVFGITINELLTDDDSSDVATLDSEWIEIVHEAMASGVSKEQFRDFLAFNKWKLENQRE